MSRLTQDPFPGATAGQNDGPARTGADTGAAGGQRGGRRAARWLVLLALLAAALILTVANPTAGSSELYHPANPAPSGAQALARALGDHGIPVVIATNEAALRAASPGPGTTVVVSSTVGLREATTTTLARIAAPADRLVLVNPDRATLRRLLPQVGLRLDTAPGALTADCNTPDVHSGEHLSRTQSLYRDPAATASCFTKDGYAAYLVTATATLKNVVLLGSTDAIANGHILEADNAAIALRTLGHSPKLIWYVPTLLDVPAQDATGSEPLLPRWWQAVVLLAFVALLALMWWRGRRLGRLVREPLPVLVRAIETTEHRARLYRKAADGSRPSAVLREATRRRLTAYLGLPPGANPDQLIDAVVTATGRPYDQVAWMLAGQSATTETDMLALAAALAALEKEIRRT